MSEMLSAQELIGMRHDYEETFVHRCDVWRQDEIRDPLGGFRTEWIVATADLPCKVSPSVRYIPREEVHDVLQILGQQRWTLSVPVYSDIRKPDRVQIKFPATEFPSDDEQEWIVYDTTFEVESVSHSRTWGIYLLVGLVEVA